MLSPDVSKVVVLIVLFISTFTFSMVPLKLVSLVRNQADPNHRRRLQVVLSLLNCYAAGVFLAECLLALLPDTRIKVTTALERIDENTDYPVTEFVIVIGLFTVLFIDQMVLVCNKEDGEESAALIQPIEDDNQDRPSPEKTLTINRPTRRVRSGQGDHPCPSDSYSHRDGDMTILSDSDSIDSYGQIEGPGMRDSDSEDEEQHIERSGTSNLSRDPNSHSPVRSLLLLAALSVHSVFEGLTVGFMTTTQKVLQIFAALVLHKCIIAFSMGTNFVQSKLTLKTILKSNLIFSIASPIGIAIGTVVISHMDGTSVGTLFASGILQGIGCGTFLYIVFFEILPDEFKSVQRTPSRLLKLLFLIFGYGTIAVVILFHSKRISPGEKCLT